MESSPSIKELAAALTKAQTAMGGARKDKNNPAFKSKYADLSSVVEAIDGAIPAHGLAYVQVSHDKESAAAIETIILHQSGEWLSCGTVSVPVTKGDAHGFGSALTYARRYSLSSAFGVVPEDDDGNAAANAAPKRVETAKPPTRPTQTQESQCMDFVALIEGCKDMPELEEAFKSAWKTIHPMGFPMMDNLLLQAKNDRKASISEHEPVSRKAA